MLAGCRPACEHPMMMKPRVFSLSLAATALAAAGCTGGGGTEAGICAGTFAACGGDPEGSWEVAGACFDKALVQVLDEGLTANAPACAGAVKAATLTIGGTLAYRAGTVTYDMTTRSESSIAYTTACMTALRPNVAADAAACASLAPAPGDPEKTGSCAYTGTTCDCTVTGVEVDASVRSYTVTGATITESGGASYDFCVSGATMTQHAAIHRTSHGILTFARQ